MKKMNLLTITLMFIPFESAMYLEKSNWFKHKMKPDPLPKNGVVQGNCDSLLRELCDSNGVDYNTIGTTSDPNF
jgi:hypothetical protein